MIHGDGSDHRLLVEEGIEAQDAFVALTSIDEENVIMSMLVSRLEGVRLITKVNRLQLEDFDDIEIPIGSVVNPKKITSEEVVRYVRSFERSIGSNMESLYMVADNRVEACEFLVKNDERIVDIPLQELHLKKNVIVAAIVRNNTVISPHTAALMPMNAPSTNLLSPMYLSRTASISIEIKAGSTTPKVAAAAPANPRFLYPT